MSDDYGVSKLQFRYSIVSASGIKRNEAITVPGVVGLDRPFVFSVDFRSEDINISDRIDYSFVVYDNDGVNGSKSTESQRYSYAVPSLSELNAKRNEEQREIEGEMKKLLEKSKEFKKNLDRLKKESQNNDAQSWKTKADLNQLKKDQVVSFQKLG